jgi:osmotically-inducible protein OsmY
MDDKIIRQHVIEELDFEPSIDAEHIGVAVEDGVVTLTGHVSSYAQKVEAEAAAQRVKGVRGIALEIDVRYPFEGPVQDDQIAKRAADALAWNLVPKDSVSVTVQKGWVVLTGQVQWQYQKVAAESAVRKLEGVTGVTNRITLKPSVLPKDVKKQILAALHRNAQVEGEGVTVVAKGGAVTLSGHVRTWQERTVVERAAWSAPGVTGVDNKLAVEMARRSPDQF